MSNCPPVFQYGHVETCVPDVTSDALKMRRKEISKKYQEVDCANQEDNQGGRNPM
jgi:hypothetical protein